MSPQNREKLEKYRFVLNNRSFTPSPGFDLNEVLEVIREEWDRDYTVDWSCNYCVMKMVETAFSKIDK